MFFCFRVVFSSWGNPGSAAAHSLEHGPEVAESDFSYAA